jgi:hypothetical protein
MIVLNVHATSEDERDNSKDSINEELEQVFYNFSKYHTKTLLGDVNAKVGRGNIFKPKIGNENLRPNSNDNGVRIGNFATSKNVVVKSTMFQHRNIHKYICTSVVNQIYHILIDSRWHSNILDIRSFRVADYDTDHYLVFAKLGKDWQYENMLQRRSVCKEVV